MVFLNHYTNLLLFKIFIIFSWPLPDCVLEYGVLTSEEEHHGVEVIPQKQQQVSSKLVSTDNLLASV